MLSLSVRARSCSARTAVRVLLVKSREAYQIARECRAWRPIDKRPR